MIAMIIVICSLKAGVPVCATFPGRSPNMDMHRSQLQAKPITWGPRK